MTAAVAAPREHPFRRAADLLGGRRVLGQEIDSWLDIHDLIVKGLPARALSHLVERVPGLKRPEMLEKAVGMSLRTYQRRKDKPDAALSREQGGRAWRFAELLAHATRVFKTEADAEEWFESEAYGLGWRKPIDLLSTPAGADIIETYLGRIEYGVYT